jgi:hypothetical protein
MFLKSKNWAEQPLYIDTISLHTIQMLPYQRITSLMVGKELTLRISSRHYFSCHHVFALDALHMMTLSCAASFLVGAKVLFVGFFLGEQGITSSISIFPIIVHILLLAFP